MSGEVSKESIRAAAMKAVKGIIFDLSDRRGLKSEWNEIDDDIKREIKAKWANIIAKEIKVIMEAGGR